jgi:hypothetical protein
MVTSTVRRLTNPGGQKLAPQKVKNLLPPPRTIIMAGMCLLALYAISVAPLPVLAQSEAVLCSGETCKGPISAVFVGPDCSGSPTNGIQEIIGIDLVNDTVVAGACLTTAQRSVSYQCLDDSVLIREYFADDCSGPSQNTSHPLRKCFSFPQLGNTSRVYLCNANDTIDHSEIAPPDTIAEPVFYVDPVDDGPQICPQIGQCTPGVPFSTRYSSTNCNSSTAVVSTEISPGALTNNCYNNSALAYNFQLNCSSNGTLIMTRYPSQCNTTAFFTQRTPTDVCLHISSGLGESVRYSCGKSNTPSAPSPNFVPTSNIPTGSASLISAASSLTLLIAIAVFFLY